MKVYQTIHKYPPHIPLFEKRHGLGDDSNITFAELQQLIIKDGYAASYILEPALLGRTDEVFYTIWDYERLQFLWAKEHGIDSKDLSAIKKAQIEWFKPDVFYNHSAFCDDDFIEKYPLPHDIIKVCWYGIIAEKPEAFPLYDIRLTLHRPYIAQWSSQGLNAYELQPSFYNPWSAYVSEEKNIDLLFYGQTAPSFFKNRNQMLEKIVALNDQFKIHVYFSFPKFRKIFDLPFLRDFLKFGFISKSLSKHALPPLYGDELYTTLGQAKFTLNGYTNYNKDFKSNMRLFEALGCGSLLISEMGNYPDGFEEGKHLIGYRDNEDLLNKLPDILSNYDSLKNDMQPHISRIMQRYSKTKQWQHFEEIISQFSK